MAQASENGRAAPTSWVELVVALVIAVGAAVVVYDSRRLGAGWADDGPQAGYVPYLVGCALALAALWVAGGAIWRWKKLSVAPFVRLDQLKPVLTLLVPTIVYVVLIKWIGLYVASALYIGLFMIWQGKYRVLPAVAVALGVPIAAFLLFEVWFLVPLPKGPLEHLIGY